MLALLLSLVSGFAQTTYEVDDITTVLPEEFDRDCLTVGGLYAPTRSMLRGYTVSCNMHGVQPYLSRKPVLIDGEYRRRIRVCYPWDLEPIPAEVTCEVYDPDGNFFAFWMMNFIEEF